MKDMENKEKRTLLKKLEKAVANEDFDSAERIQCFLNEIERGEKVSAHIAKTEAEKELVLQKKRLVNSKKKTEFFKKVGIGLGGAATVVGMCLIIRKGGLGK